MAFNSNIKTRFDVQVAVRDFFAQKAFDVYRGFLQLFTIQRRQPVPLTAPVLDIGISSLLTQQVNTCAILEKKYCGKGVLPPKEIAPPLKKN